MTKRTLEVRGETVEFETHRVGYGHTPYFAVNVKVHGLYSVKPSAAFLPLWDALASAAKDELWQQAYEATQEDWWFHATYECNTALGHRPFSEGRQGGWLVLPNYSLAKMEELAEEANAAECQNCGHGFNNHADGQCLFEPTRYAPSTAGSYNELLSLRSFAERVSELLKDVPDMFRSQLDTLLANLPTEDNPLLSEARLQEQVPAAS